MNVIFIYNFVYITIILFFFTVILHVWSDYLFNAIIEEKSFKSPRYILFVEQTAQPSRGGGRWQGELPGEP